MSPRRSRPRLAIALAAAAAAALLPPAAGRALELEVGDPAPPFALEGSDGRTHRLADHAGRRHVVLAWFPKAFTPGCTREMQTMRDAADAIAAHDAAVYLVSLDTPEDNRAFAEAEGARQVVLSDPSGEVARAYGVLGPGGLYARRWTFYIDPEGRIAAIDRDVAPGSAGPDIAARLASLGVPPRAGARLEPPPATPEAP